jgi:hypothetical protein
MNKLHESFIRYIRIVQFLQLIKTVMWCKTPQNCYLVPNSVLNNYFLYKINQFTINIKNAPTNLNFKFGSLNKQQIICLLRKRHIIYIIFSGSAAQRGLWPAVALQPSAGYGLLWLSSPARAMSCCGSPAQRGLWPPVALQPRAGYGLLWLCSPERAMASFGSAAQHGLWPPVALQPSAGYGLLWLCTPARAMAS